MYSILAFFARFGNFEQCRSCPMRNFVAGSVSDFFTQVLFLNLSVSQCRRDLLQLQAKIVVVSLDRVEASLIEVSFFRVGFLLPFVSSAWTIGCDFLSNRAWMVTLLHSLNGNFVPVSILIPGYQF